LTVWSWRLLILDAVVLPTSLIILGGVSSSGGGDGTLVFAAPFLFVGAPIVAVGSLLGIILTTMGRIKHRSSRGHLRCAICHVSMIVVLVAALVGVFAGALL
jgi:hypothetical protein